MTAYDNFNTDFIERTLQILKSFDGEYDVTLLINCAVGLIMIPKEHHFHTLSNIRTAHVLNNNAVRYIDNKNTSLQNIVRHMRNSIAHGRISQETREGQKIQSLKFEDKYEDKLTFRAIFTVEEFKEFSIAIATEILKRNVSKTSLR